MSIKSIDYYYNLKNIAIISSDEKKSLLIYIEEVLDSLEQGALKVVNRVADTYEINFWIKKAILLYFKLKNISEYKFGEALFYDKFFLRKTAIPNNTRLVPFFTALRRGAYIGSSCILMPPAYINIGAYLDDNSMLESLLGSCAYVGKNCHISAGAVIGGVLDPVEASPVIIGDNVLLAENSGVSQGVRLGDLCVLAPGVHISKGTAVFDAVNKKAYLSSGTYSIKEEFLNKNIKIYLKDNLIEAKDSSYGPVIPSGALVINGISTTNYGALKVVPLITKYINSLSERSFALEESLRL